MTYDCELLDNDFIGQMFTFYAFTATWLLQLADPNNKGLPLPQNPSDDFGFLPEFIVSNLTEFTLFAIK